MLKRNFRQASIIETLTVRETNGNYRNATENEIIQAAKALMNSRFSKMTPITQPRETFDFLQIQLADMEHEIFAVLWMDTKHRPIAFEEIFRGTIDGANVYPREIVKAALSHNAAAAILCHNHPSGDTVPSESDKVITGTLKDALNLINVRILDHVIIGEDKPTSLSELGIL